MEIKFRVLDIDRQKMLNIENIVFNNGKYYEDYRDFEDGITLGNIVVMQYVGIEDKNGIDIFEKDIVKINIDDGFDFVGNIGFVDFSEKEREYAIFCDNEPFYRLNGGKLEVIGNIYENPELLEG